MSKAECECIAASLATPHRNELPFTQTVRRTLYWYVQPTGDYAVDFETGEQFATAFIRRLAEEEIFAMLCWIVRAFPQKLSGIEVGFLHSVAVAASVGSSHLTAYLAREAALNAAADAASPSADD